MSREHFLQELGYLLSDLAEDERETALEYYRDYFDEAGPEDEAEILEHLGSPEKVAAEIRWGLREDGQSGEFSERGYRDERFAEDNQVPDKYAQTVRSTFQRSSEEEERGGRCRSRHTRRSGDQEDRNGRNGLLLILLFIFFGLPLMGSIISAGFSVVFGILGGVLGIFGGLFGLIAAGFAGIIGLIAGGIGLIGGGVGMLVSMTSLPVGLMSVCLGFLSVAVGMLLIIAVRWGCVVAVPGVCRFCVGIVGQFCRWFVGILRRILDRIFGRGGVEQ